MSALYMLCIWNVHRIFRFIKLQTLIGNPFLHGPHGLNIYQEIDDQSIIYLKET